MFLPLKHKDINPFRGDVNPCFVNSQSTGRTASLQLDSPQISLQGSVYGFEIIGQQKPFSQETLTPYRSEKEKKEL